MAGLHITQAYHRDLRDDSKVTRGQLLASVTYIFTHTTPTLSLNMTLRADQRKTAMYRGSNRIQIAARVNIMHPKKFGDHHRDENMDYRRDGGVQKGNCDNYLHLAIHFSGQYPRAKIFCTRMFYFPVTH